MVVPLFLASTTVLDTGHFLENLGRSPELKMRTPEEEEEEERLHTAQNTTSTSPASLWLFAGPFPVLS